MVDTTAQNPNLENGGKLKLTRRRKRLQAEARRAAGIATVFKVPTPTHTHTHTTNLSWFLPAACSAPREPGGPKLALPAWAKGRCRDDAKPVQDWPVGAGSPVNPCNPTAPPHAPPRAGLSGSRCYWLQHLRNLARGFCSQAPMFGSFWPPSTPARRLAPTRSLCLRASHCARPCWRRRFFASMGNLMAMGNLGLTIRRELQPRNEPPAADGFLFGQFGQLCPAGNISLVRHLLLSLPLGHSSDPSNAHALPHMPIHL